ncbi:uncharacterized protein [Antedon mediterranea]|uniref:uncharacterized protein n=1 Tax=Antedon mediterranea TaxID=105859 RepID=UPI003AF5D1C5
MLVTCEAVIFFRMFKTRFFTENRVYISFILAASTISCFALKLWYKKSNKCSECVIVFSRYPQAGTTKKRLIGEIGEYAAATVQLIMTNQILDRVINLQKSRSSVGAEIHYSGGTSEQLKYWLDRKSQKMQWIPQNGTTLGYKMSNAFKQAFQSGVQYAVIVGSDIPAIDESTMTSALTSLHQDFDMVLGPAKDGGYYLIGLNINILTKLGQENLDCLFEDIDWGTGKVRQQQLAVAKQHNIRVTELPIVLQDIDTADDLSEFERSTGVTVKDLTCPTLSVVIPVLNEGKNIQKILTNVTENCTWTKSLEVIVVDGGSVDETEQQVRMFAEQHSNFNIKFISSSKGRGPQQKAGVSASTGYNLLFLHADTTLPKRFDEHVLMTLTEPGVSGGAFSFGVDILHSDDGKIDNQYSRLFCMQMKFLQRSVHYRCRKYEMPYGDQAIFVNRRTLEQVGGFPDVLLFEDFILIKNLQEVGHVQTVKEQYAITSCRRYQKYGQLRTSGMNFLFISAYKLGVHPNTLARWYYGH